MLFCNELHLDRDFVERKRALFATRTRGFAYWTWKPYLIERELLKLEEGDLLVYSDVGNHFTPKAGRVAEYATIARAMATPIISPVLSGNFLERSWTKREVLRRFGVEDNGAILDTPQREANFLVIVNNQKARHFIRMWNETHERRMDLFDDSKTLTQDAAFVDHRHDQSVFSILSKLHGVTTIPPEIDDFVLRLRDRPMAAARLTNLLFLVKNGLVSAAWLGASTGCTVPGHRADGR